jgi:acylphosphatase
MNRVGVRGYVKNLLDGSVEVVVECSDKNIETILEILKSGSERSSVKSIDKKSIGVDEVDEVRLSDTFEVRY